jgi:glycosyltransferase involved in cell wall biosynthesis
MRSSARVLVLAVDNKGSTVARVERVIGHGLFGLEVVDLIKWPQSGERWTQNQLVDRLLKAEPHADVLLNHRVLLPVAAQTRVTARGIPAVFDFDDAIYAVPSSVFSRGGVLERGKRPIRQLLRGRADYSSRYRPLTRALRQAAAVAAGNAHLAAFGARFCPKTEVVPTCVDCSMMPEKAHTDVAAPVIGWYGSPDNHWYLEALVPVFEAVRAERRGAVRFRVISTRPVSSPVTFEWDPWDRSREYEQLLEFDVGVMPLVNDEWAAGKCANKALLYMGLGIPPVVSPVGANSSLVSNGENGYCANGTDEWVALLLRLLGDWTLRRRLGEGARQTVKARFDLPLAVATLQSLLEAISRQRGWEGGDG